MSSASFHFRRARDAWSFAAGVVLFCQVFAASRVCAETQSGTPGPPKSAATESTAEAPQDAAQSGENDADDTERGPFRVHEALGAPDWLTLLGSQRTRYSGLARQFRPGLDARDQALSLRTLLTLGATLGPISVVGELQDSRAYLTDENSAVSTIVVNALEPLQAYIDLYLENTLRQGQSWELRAGRQTLDLGGRRLIARNRFRNTIQNYDGITTRWRSSTGARLLAFAMLPVPIEPSNRDREALLDNRIEIDREGFHLGLWGAFYEQPLGPDISLEAYFFGLNEADRKSAQTPNRQLYTPGLRIVRKPAAGHWDVDVESVLQLGKRRESAEASDTQDHRVLASFQHLSAGYTCDLPWSPRFSAELDYGSGDDPSTEGRHERFDSLFGPRRSEFGPTGLYGPMGRENIVSSGLRVGIEPHARVEGFVSWRANWLANPRDVFARTEVHDPSGESGAFAGNQIEGRARLWIVPESIRFELGGAAFIEGPFLRNAPNATGYGNPLFVYTDLELFF